MRIAMIVNSFPELSEKFIANQVTGLMDAGLDLDVYSALSPPVGKRHTLAERYRLRELTTYVGTPRSTGLRLLGLPALFASNLLRSPAAALRALDVRSYASSAMNLKNLYFLQAFSGKTYDVVHCHFGPNGLIGAFLKDAGIAKRLVVSFHGSDINSYPKRHGEAVYRGMYERADAVTANTNFTKAKIVANGCPADKISIVPEGLRMEEHGESPFGDRSARTVLTVGRLVEKKGYPWSLEAIALLRKEFPDLRYLIAGDGPMRAELESKARSLGIADAVSFLGFQSDTEVVELYRRASVFLLPSVTASDGDMEGQGLVLQEAQACGLPVVSTLHNGIPEGLREGETGFLVPERDAAAAAERVAALLRDKALRETMGRAGRAFVRETYDAPAITKRLEAIYARITA